jgi:hypothetical protein
MGNQPRRCIPASRGDEDVRETGRDHEIADPQRREEDLAEAAEIDHAPGRVEPLQRGQRPARVAILAVVIVLEDPDARALGPLQQRESPNQAHGDAERILVGGRDVRELRDRRPPRRDADPEPFGIDGNGTEA